MVMGFRLPALRAAGDPLLTKFCFPDQTAYTPSNPFAFLKMSYQKQIKMAEVNKLISLVVHVEHCYHNRGTINIINKLSLK